MIQKLSSISRHAFLGFGLLLPLVLLAPPSEAREKRAFSDAELEVMPAPGPNPFLSFLPADAEVDWEYWHAKMEYDARKRRARQLTERSFSKLLNVAEAEPNDSLATAQSLAGFGTGAGDDDEADVAGTIAAPAVPTMFATASEDNGAIGSSSSVGVTDGAARTTTSTLGDGPHGSSGSGSGDFDFFTVTGVAAGDVITVQVDTANPTAALDPNTAIWDSSGNLLAFNEDISFFNFDSALVFTASAPGTYYVSVGGFRFGAVVPSDPFDSSSGPGSGSEGDYSLTIGLNANDKDCYAVALELGDVLGVNATGNATLVEVFEPGGELQMGSPGDGSGLYPAGNPLPGGDVVADFVTYLSGDHVVCVQGDAGAYTAELRVFRTSLETNGGTQTIFIDFDGATLDSTIFGGTSVSATLSPLSSFLSDWGLAPGDESAVIDSILASVEESLVDDLALASNPLFEVKILNSRDHADPFGQPNVSRLIVGGTIAEFTVSTIGIAESIDPGNFNTAESAVILLDLLSGPASDGNSLNQFGLAGGATMIDLVGTGVGNITAHEAGHYLGNWHTENSSAVAAIMDQGGNLANSVGVGADAMFGTLDDVDVDFLPDTFAVSEGFDGTEHTDEKTAFGLSGEGIFCDDFESGTTAAWSSVIP